MRLALRNCGRINPENIDEYLALDGYKALQKVLEEMKKIVDDYVDDRLGIKQN